ncbi:hypothetical protein ACFC00_29120 [Streptomyces adustus]|uniref:hypothetical protein n=1 Tax=Streptomyces adustus TaxID=1609272 RepID=UPI0035DC1A64
MGSLFEELEAREAAARTRVEVLEAEFAEMSGRLSAAREGLERLRIARETVAEVLTEMTPQKPGTRLRLAGRSRVSRWRRRMRGPSGRSSGR